MSFKGIIKRLSLFAIAAFFMLMMNSLAFGQLFSQDFQSSTTLSSYVSATPSNGQFNTIGTSGSGVVASINTVGGNNTLQYVRNGANTGNFTRSTNFSVTPTTLLYKFDLTISGNSTASTSAVELYVGSGFTANNTNEANANVYSKIGINLTTTNGTFSIRDISNSASSSNFSGTQTITWALNNSGSTINYLAPDGTTETLANDKFDVFVGTTRVFNDSSVTTASQTLTDIKGLIGGGSVSTSNYTIQLDNFLIDQITLITPNTSPTITPASGITRQQGTAASNSTIATVSDNETAAGSLTVTAISAPTGITVSNIINAGGTITADIEASCAAAIGDNTVVLQVSDGTTTTNGNLIVNVTANTAPTLTYSDTSVASGGSTTNTPTAASDNGTIVSYAVQSQGTYTGTISVSNTGVVSISNAAPAGTHTITIRATDDCGLFTDASFTLTVNAPTTTFSISDVTMAEGNSLGTTNFVFTVTRSGDVSGISTVLYATASNTAIDGQDYTQTSGTLTFNPSETTMTIIVPIAADITTEPDETFFVNLVNSTNATITDAQGVGTILNDEVFSTGTIPAGTYTNLDIGATATLGGAVTVTGTLTLNGILDASGNTLTLTCAAGVVGADADSYVTGNVRKNFCGNTAFSFPVGENGYTPVTVTPTNSPTDPTALTVDVVDATLPGLNAADAVSRHWTLTETGTLVATLSFTYLDADVPPGTADEADFRIWRNAGGLTNFCPNSPCVNTATNTVTTQTAVSDFSPWGVGELLAPTAGEVEVGGRVLEANGRGVSRARVTMIDSQGVSRVTYTNQFGYYRFKDVEAGATYIFSVSHLRHQFAPSPRIQSIVEDTMDINFTAIE